VQNAEKAVIRIEDNGVGIDPEVVPRIFEMFFHQAENSLGTGLGLYIAKEAVSKMGGQINVTSEPKSWTRFMVEIPNRI
jgi:signal transduction histidine kinase